MHTTTTEKRAQSVHYSRSEMPRAIVQGDKYSMKYWFACMLPADGGNELPGG
jgi:hypothetical protein